MKIYWMFIILAILCALFSDRIDKATKSNKKLRKVILVFCGGVLLISAIGLVVTMLTN